MFRGDYFEDFLFLNMFPFLDFRRNKILYYL
jgi:hypothetical protein